MVGDLVDLAVCFLDSAVEGRASDQLGGFESVTGSERDERGERMVDVLLRLPMPVACQ
jgi:hypothetical protein